MNSTVVLIGVVAFPVVALVGALLFFVALDHTRFRGTIRLMHLLTPFGFTFEEIPDLTGKYFIVTGANSGLGFGTCQELAQKGGHVILCSRNMKKGEEAKRAMGPVKGTITVMELDLSSLVSVKRFAVAYKNMKLPLHSLILNAGVMVPPFELTNDGLESQFGVNHLAHFALTKDLLSLLKSTAHSSIVSVSSLAHWFPVKSGVLLDVKAINDESKYVKAAWYGQSKLFNLLMMRELARREPSIMCNAVHPGAVQGNLNRHLTGNNVLLQTMDAVAQFLLYWPNRLAALTVLAPAVSPLVFANKTTGQYFVPIGRVDAGSPESRDESLAKRAWEFSEQVLASKGWDKME